MNGNWNMKHGVWITITVLSFGVLDAGATIVKDVDFPMSQKAHALYSLIGEREKPELILDGHTVLNIKEMDRLGYKKVQLEKEPWSDSYWPTAKGQTAARYGAKNPADSDWPHHYNFFLSNPPDMIVATGTVEKLSPAEKYDLLIGDSHWTLTHHQWQEGEQVNKKFGFVPAWTGICHGWAAAAIAFETPAKSVNVTAANGATSIRFYPSDIKALASLLWANGISQTRFAGDVCRAPHPSNDEVGRPLDEKCQNINPGTWHIGVVTQMGQNKKSMVMDRTYDIQIWNQPLYSYEYSYFNPQTLEPVQRLAQGLLPIAKLTKDKYKKYRAPGTQYVVGISMKVTYIAEIKANKYENQKNLTGTAKYMYDLELDGDLNIIGGEWYSNYHPDFIWTVGPHDKVYSVGDRSINPDEWTGQGPVPASWVTAARPSSKIGQPLASVVQRLVDLSKVTVSPDVTTSTTQPLPVQPPPALP
jgi:hypothetical protein